MKWDHDPQIVRIIENLKLSYGGWGAQSTTSIRHQPMAKKLYVRAIIESEARPSIVQLKSKP